MPIREIPALDGVRALALCLVVSLHIGNAGGVPGPPAARLVSEFSIWGLYLFFVLSGFLLFLPYARSILTGSSWPSAWRFYLRRARRILPVYYVALGTIIAGLFLTSGAAGVVRLLGPLATIGLLLHDMRPDAFSLVLETDGPLWSLAVEWQFYVVLPWLALGLARLAGSRSGRGFWWRLALGMVALTIYGLGWRVAAAIAHYIWGYHDPLRAPGALGLVFAATWGMEGKYLELFALGMAVSLLYVHVVEQGHIPRWRIGTIALPASLLGLGGCFAWAVLVHRLPVPTTTETFIFPSGTGWTWMVAGAWALGICCGALLVAVLMGPSIIGRIFSWAPLRYIGMISYSLYVWHLFVILALIGLKVSHHNYFLLTGSTWIMLLIVGSLSYWYIERPFLVGRPRVR